MKPLLYWRPLSKTDTALYKGVGILLIVLHNYGHWVVPKVGQNEFGFSPQRIKALFSAVADSPLETIHLFFTYFGHFGVQIFIFLSAYGLTKAYGDRPIQWFSFVWKRLIRLYPVFIAAIGVHALMTAWLSTGGWSIWYLKIYALKLTFLSNLVPGQSFTVSGPWWFFSFVVQFYLVFHLLNGIALKYGDRGLLTVGLFGWIFTILFNPYFESYEINLYVTVIGRLPELCLGMYLARAKEISIRKPLLFFIVIVWVLGNWFPLAWYLQSLATLILLLIICQKLSNWVNPKGYVYVFLLFIGRISFPLFAVHGVLRRPFVDFANETSYWLATLLIGVLFLLVSIMLASLIMLGNQWIQKQMLDRSEGTNAQRDM